MIYELSSARVKNGVCWKNGRTAVALSDLARRFYESKLIAANGAPFKF